MPPRLATLIYQFAGQPAPGTTLTRLAGPPRWLFPGNDPARPASHDHLRTGLTRHAITPHAGRNTGVGALAAELPAPVLAGITGLHITHRDQLDTQHQPRLDSVPGGQNARPVTQSRVSRHVLPDPREGHGAGFRVKPAAGRRPGDRGCVAEVTGRATGPMSSPR